jgi:hypothetical protein|tara:strand:- start:2591 stop:2986 length:396 start_codon:yes stop_codon:yes gene_type:complete
MKKIIDWFSTGVIGEINKVIDNLFTSDEERMQAKNEMLKVLKEQQLELQKLQTEIILAEANGNWLQRSWRPILMLAFGFIVIYVKFIAPVFTLPIPPLENEFWNLLQIGIGGYVIGRTGEKIAKEYASTKK